MTTFRLRAAALAVACVAAAAPPAADAGEGVLPVPAGDGVRGTLARCGDRHVAEVELLRGETLRVRVAATGLDTEAVQLRVVDPTGWNVSPDAHVRVADGAIVAGPYRVAVSGVHRLEVTSFSRHDTAYELTTSVRRLRPAPATLGERRPSADIAVAAGATLRIRARGEPSLALRAPGADGAVVLAPDGPELRALRGGGLAAPRSGVYTLELLGGSRRVRVAASRAPRRAPRFEEFPTLPAAPTAVASWQGAAGWVVDRSVLAPDEHGTPPPPPPPPPLTSPWLGAVADPAPSLPDVAPLADPGHWTGPGDGVGRPFSGLPSVADVLRDGVAADLGAGPVYRIERPTESGVALRYDVRFEVDGRPARAPVTGGGRTTVHWHVEGGTPWRTGDWVRSFDPERGVDVLDGVETLQESSFRTLQVAARGFAVETEPGAWPTGGITLAVTDSRPGLGFSRRETYDGTPRVAVEVTTPDGAPPREATHEID